MDKMPNKMPPSEKGPEFLDEDRQEQIEALFWAYAEYFDEQQVTVAFKQAEENLRNAPLHQFTLDDVYEEAKRILNEKLEEKGWSIPGDKS